MADTLGVFVDPVFSSPELYSSGTLWLAMFAFAGQIFGDFAGYSLMAIGIARMLGFELPENFRMPYISRSITEFWRRWHISLSSWLRDYLYISLGGNRHGAIRTYVNLMLTMILGGLWHGASWNFVLWGAMHGAALALHKVWMMLVAFDRDFWVYRFFAWLITLIFVCVLWVPFRADSFQITTVFLGGLFSLQEGIQWMHPHVIAVLGGLIIWHAVYLLRPKLLMLFPASQLSQFRVAFVLSFVVLSLFIFSPSVSSPFVYFQF